MKIVFATNNKHKIEEVKKILPPDIELLTLFDIGCEEDLPETGNTFEQNAAQKARYIHDKYGYDCFADDSGLEAEALHGRPGVYSARYAGTNSTSTANVTKLLSELNMEENRKAKFRTVIALMIGEETSYFEGEIKGEITLRERGSNGFGYDPVFVPEGFHVTFAEMAPELKNKISHRSIAVQKLAEFLTAEK
ncbi:MAG: non-canonical purine NTP diphosphatase [Bacteroidetes bacterium]|nr:non-canonical purine NTP diphosphatase [Bacteroidota bacterium]